MAGLLRPSLPLAGIDRVAGSVDVVADGSPGRPALRRLLEAREGDEVTFEGPLGRGFELDPRGRHLLLVADVDGLPAVRSLASEAIAIGRSVTLLLGAPSVNHVYPASLFPDEVEYVVATGDGTLGHHGRVTDLMTEYEAWADQCFAAGSPELLAAMALLARGRDGRLGVARLGSRRRRPQPRSSVERRRRSWLQVAVGLGTTCALGVCLGCTHEGPEGPQRACREGPAFAADELAWERGA